MYPRLLESPLRFKKSFFLFGPRGTGKTSWLKEKLPNALFFDLLHMDTYTALLQRPSLLEEKIPPHFDDWIIIDEIQKIPALLNEVHRIIEAKKYRFVLTGSSARTLRRRGVNLLAGRAHSYKMFPLTAVELGQNFNLQQSLLLGQLPAVHEDPKSAAQYLHSYIGNYLREEVLQEGLTRNLGAFQRFLEIASFSQASVLNMTEVARESSINRKVVENYFSILEDLLIATRLPVFSKKAQRKIVSHPKFFFFDTGVYYHIRPKGPLDSLELAEGPLFETLVFQELRAINEYYQFAYDLYFWRTVEGLEVDFILYGQKGLIAIEVKRSKTVQPADLKGLLAFGKDYPIAKLYLFYGGKETLYKEKITILPIEQALKSLPEVLKITPLA